MNSPPIVGPILVGIGMFTGVRAFDPWPCVFLRHFFVFFVWQRETNRNMAHPCMCWDVAVVVKTNAIPCWLLGAIIGPILVGIGMFIGVRAFDPWPCVFRGSFFVFVAKGNRKEHCTMYVLLFAGVFLRVCFWAKGSQQQDPQAFGAYPCMFCADERQLAKRMVQIHEQFPYKE